MSSYMYWHQVWQMYPHLPMKNKSILPDEGMEPRLMEVANLYHDQDPIKPLRLLVKIDPKPAPGTRWGHRLRTLCPTCNKWQSHGRMNQHFPACRKV